MAIDAEFDFGFSRQADKDKRAIAKLGEAVKSIDKNAKMALEIAKEQESRRTRAEQARTFLREICYVKDNHPYAFEGASLALTQAELLQNHRDFAGIKTDYFHFVETGEISPSEVDQLYRETYAEASRLVRG